MKYMLLIYGDEKAGPEFGSPEFGPYMGAYKAATETYVKDGVMVAGEALEPVATATSVRVRGGRTETMDGPYAETKEQLGGFYILDCKNLDEAIRYAAMIPDAANGTVEIRPVMDLSAVM
ncbi:MAG: YciI family protein [Brucellaceae bacterium]|nr:YciI family protein [Brucellaceae bacterium]